MGAAPSSLMQGINSYSMAPNRIQQEYLAYGPTNIILEDSEVSTTSSPILRNAKFGTPKQHEAFLKEYFRKYSLSERIQSTCLKHSDSKKVAYRPVIRKAEEEVNGKPLEVTYLGETRYHTLGEMWRMIENFGRGLHLLGVRPRSNVCIFAETCWEWLVTIHGIWTQNMVATTVYSNLGDNALHFALRQTECPAIICNALQVPHLLQAIEDGKVNPCYVIYLGTLPSPLPSFPEGGKASHARVFSWNEIIKMGGRAPDIAIRVPTGAEDWDALALIMYTSGTTGDPKGVMHTVGSLSMGVAILDTFLRDILPSAASAEGEAYCAYLPLAHILEFAVVNVFLMRAALIGFGTARTLTSLTTRPHGDFAEYNPRVVVAVPRVFDTIRRAVESQLQPVGTVKRSLFDTAYKGRLAALQRHKDTPVYNKLVFRRARAMFGTRYEMLLSGGGPMSAATKEFISVVFGPVCNGWGLTETVCVGAVQRVGDLDPNTCGQVLPANEIKVVDAEDYKHTDEPEARGELCVRGPFLFKGYYKQPEQTKAAIDEEGWFHTGDVGSISKDGRIKIVGRIKALAKNCLGEYIAMEALESIYAAHPLVLNNCICVLVHPDRNYIGAVLVTDEEKVKNFVKTCGWEFSAKSPKDLIQDDKFTDFIANSLSECGKEAKRLPFELPRKVCLTLEEWSAENNMLTPSMKLRRQCVEKKFRERIAKMFQE